MSETYYEVHVIGPIWQPGFTAANAVNVDADDLMQYARADDETDQDYELRMVQCTADHQLGDFSGIDAWRVVRVTAGSERCSECGTIKRAEHSEIVLVDFTDDEEIAWSDAMYGVDA